MDFIKRNQVAMYINDRRKRNGTFEPSDPELYEVIRNYIHQENPVHSLYRSALIHDTYREMIGGSASKADKFYKQLDKIGMSRHEYLGHAKMMARQHGYVPDLLSFAENNDNKLKYESPKGIRYFGKAGYNDYIIYQFLEKEGEVERGVAKKKRHVFRESHEAISRIHKLDRYSPNELPINILW